MRSSTMSLAALRHSKSAAYVKRETENLLLESACRDCPDAAAARHERNEPSVQPPHAPAVLLLHAPPTVNHNSARHSAHAEEDNLRSNTSQSVPQPNMQITVQQQHGRVSPYFENVTR
jgi:hypothetical protein